MLAKLFKYAGLGFLIGIVVGYVIAILTGIDSPTDNIGLFIPVTEKLLKTTGGSIPLALAFQGLFSGLYGAVCFAGIIFYEIDRMPLAVATTLHCLMIVLGYIPVGLFMGWIGSVTTELIIASCQIVGFFIIWLIMYARGKAEVRRLNELQKNLTNAETK